MKHLPGAQNVDGTEIPPVDKRRYEKPVAWLLGRQVVNSFRGALLYAALGSKLDARDWMNAEVFEVVGDSEHEFWFDYLSDTGDGVTATYSLAYLSMSSLWVDGGNDGTLSVGDSVALTESIGSYHLPRGQFLFVGGDTAYHASDYATLANRFQLPFRWAYADLIDAGQVREGDFCRPLFGVPGNHDYYDQLDGFRRQFRAPVRTEICGNLHPSPSDPQLMIPGHRRFQTASYLAIKMPFGWWMWGLDTEVGEVDERQLKFFREIRQSAGADPDGLDKLIVTTCAPSTVFGKYADGRTDTKCARAYWQLGLPRPFLAEAALEPGEPRLRDDQMRLDLSGDIHVYARYWGPASGGPQRDKAQALQPASHNYASVVSGLGGAFHHPSQTYVDEVQEQRLYPPVAQSRTAIANELFKPWKLWNGGGVWLVGFVAGFIIYFAATVVPSSRDALNNTYLDNAVFRDFNLWSVLGFSQDTKVCPTIPSEDQPREIVPFRLWSALLPSVPEVRTAYSEVRRPDCDRLKNCATPTGSQPAYFSGSCAVYDTPNDYSLGVILALLTFVPIIASFLKHDWFFKDPDLVKTGTAWKAKPGAQPRAWFLEPPFLKNLFLAALPMMGLAALAVLSIRPYRAHITPFGNSMLVLVSIIWSVAAVLLYVRYSDWLFHKAMVRTLSRWDWLMTWVLLIYAALSLGFGVWFFGKNNQMAYVLHDIVFILVAAGIFLGLVMLGYFKAGEMRVGFAPRIPLLILGAAHAFVQMVIPFVLVRKGSWLVLLIALVLIAGFGLLGRHLMRRNQRWLLAVTGLIYAATMILLPAISAWLFGPPESYAGSSGLFSPSFYNGWTGLIPDTNSLG